MIPLQRQNNFHHHKTDKTMKIKRLVFAGLFLMMALTLASAQVKLSFNPETGTKYEYQQEMLSSIKQNVMGQEIPVEMETSSMYLMEIMDKTPEEIKVQFTFQEITYIISSPMMRMGFDSKNPIENPSDMDNLFGKMLKGMLGSSIMMTFAPDGSVVSVTGMDAIAENMSSAVASDGQIAAQMAVQVKQQFSELSMKNSFEQAFKIYPDEPVRAGNSWTKENVMPVNNMNTDFKTKYTLKNVNRNMATVVVEGTMAMEPSAGMEGKLAGTQTGAIVVEAGTGLPVTGDVTQNIKGTVSVQGMDVQMEMVNKVKSSIKAIK